MNDAVRIAKINAMADQVKSLTELSRELLKNPVIEFLGGMVLLALLERYPVKQPLLSGYIKETLATVTLPGLIGTQQLAPFMPAIITSGSDLLKTTGAIAGLLK